MKKVVIWLLVIMVSAFGIAGLIFVSEGNQGSIWYANNGSNNELTKVDTEKEASIENIKEINIKVISSDVTVTPYDGNVIKAHFYGESNRSTNLPELEISELGKNINVEVKYPTTINFTLGRTERFYLDVQVPKNYSDDITVKSVSGNIEAVDLKASSLSLDSVSGELKGTRIAVSDDLTLKTTSGNIDFGESAGRIKAESVSGEIDITQNNLKDNITIKTVSGEIVLKIPSSSEFLYRFKTTSGKIVNGFKGSDKSKGSVEGTVGKGGSTIDVQTVSGDLELSKE
jgi:lia operon protein LiaG